MMNKRKLRVCYFGTYSMKEGYPRNRVIIEGLRQNGADVIECHEDFWKDTSQKLEGVKAGSGIIKMLYRLLFTYSKLISKFRRVGYYDALIVGYAGHIDIFLAKVLNFFRKKPLIFDAFLSIYDTAVMDRRIVRPGSFKAKLLRFIDTWSCRLADAVLLDTQAHVDYFVREFCLPAEKFHAIPVGSYLASSESYSDNPLSPQIPLNPPLLKGERGGLIEGKSGFTVLYFGSYIPLHGVDVILKAAKIIQDKDNGQLEGFSDEPSMSIDSQRGLKIEGRVIAKAEGPKQSLNVTGFGDFFASLGVPLRGPISSHPPDARNDNAEGFSGGSEVVFTLVGTGQLLPAMKELASWLGLKNVIFIDRFVSEEELMGYIMEADICLGVFGQTDKAARVIPCKVYNCLAMGKPLITMSSPATEGVLTHRDNVLLCKPGDAQDLAKAILVLRKDVSLRDQIANCGQEFFRKNFSVEAIGEKVVDILKDIIINEKD